MEAQKMRRLNIIIISGVLIIGLMGCSTSPKSPETDPAYVSPNHYTHFNCGQLNAEKVRISSKLEQANQDNATGQVLNTALAAFAISQGHGYRQKDNTAYRRLLNQYDVLEQTAIAKECNL